VHWLPAPTSATVVDVVDGGLTTVLLVVVEVVVVPIGAFGDEVRAGVVEQLARRTTRTNAVTKPTRGRFTSRSYPSPANEARSTGFVAALTIWLKIWVIP
jgi:hypothetical protein